MKTIITSIALLISLNAFSQQSSAERDSVAQTAPFQKKVKMASHKAAGNLLSDVGQPTFVIQYAQLVVSEPNGSQWLPALSYGCMTNPAVNYDSSDSDIEFTVNSIFSKYAKAYYRVVP